MTLGLLPNFVNTAALRYFYEVARFGSFRLAAEKIHIAASAISRQVQLLERELGVKLFARERAGLHLTAAGEALLYRVKKAMDELAVARSEIDALHGSQKGLVRVGINETVARDFFAGFLKRFRENHPNMKFEIVVANSDRLETMLLRGEIDILVGYAVQARNGLQQVVAFDLKTCIAVRKDDALGRKRAVRVTDLVDEVIIMPSPDSQLRQVVNAIFSKVAVKPAWMLTTDSFEFMTILVSQGLGIGFQLRLEVGADPIRPEIRYVPIREPEVKAAVLACCISEEGTPSMAVSICLQELRVALESWCRFSR
ncbi:MAG TPA: LysR family transcriptional regulator [Xanthobacteraceae bacterium]